MNIPQPSPPTFNPPPDRYVTPNSCHALGHVFVWSENIYQWRCAGCGASDQGRQGKPRGPLPLPPVHPNFQPAPIHIQLPPVTLPWTTQDEFTTPILPASPCAFDSIPPGDRNKPMMLSCSCPRCSPQC